ncbi:DUF3592 domain-containing protein [Nocardiopsis halotolerans]|uniref:DUF3592 domain-containing protein n=1 Tax=Nocardiopsis halotolerans TaxID=124252 RepID=UPI0003476135|nr:DUF3592 domain-containing protein [Nocardiopsis halotolerans]
MRLLPRSRFHLLLVFLVPTGAGLALPSVIPWFEGGYGYGLAVHVLVVVLTARVLFLWAREHVLARERDGHGGRVTAVVTGVEPPPPGEADFPGHTVTLGFTGPDGRRRRVRDTSGLGGYAPERGTRVVGRLRPEDPDDLEVVEIVGPEGRHPVTAPGPRLSPWTPAAVLALAVCLVVAVVLGPLYGLPASAAGLLPSLFVWTGVGFLCMAVSLCLSRAGLRGRATGEVTRVRTHVRGRANRSTSYSFTVRFSTPDGRRVHLHHTGEDARPRSRGARVEVRYDLDHPPRFRVTGVNGDRALMWISFLHSALFLGAGAVGALPGS